MTKKHEKLVEELDTLMIRELYTGEATWDELDEEDRATVVEAWQKAIARIGKAYADGLPLPGEQRYYMQPGDTSWWRTERKFSDDITIIVLPPTGIPVEREEEEG